MKLNDNFAYSCSYFSAFFSASTSAIKPATKILSGITAIVFLSGCHESQYRVSSQTSAGYTYSNHHNHVETQLSYGVEVESEYDTDHYYDDHTSYEYNEYAIDWFDSWVTDTYGISNGYPPYLSLTISPYENGGFFDVDWDLEFTREHYRDHEITITINNSPDQFGAQVIHSEYIDAFNEYYDFQHIQCRYYADLSISCESPNGSYSVSYIDQWIWQLPQKLYLGIEVFDYATGEYEFISTPVWFE